jgi:DNA-binding LacI/PurR family transcriptional regulator
MTAPSRNAETAARARAGSPPTIRDVATAAGVDRSTVSRVFNASSSRVPIASDTRERVMEAARRLGYRPNPLARGLAGARTMLIGAILRDFSDPFFTDAIEVLAEEAINHHYNIVVGGQGRGQEGLSLNEVLETRYCDAIIMVGDLEDQPTLLRDLRASVLPVVALWQGVSPLEFRSVDVDNRAGTMIGLRHLGDLGHERIGFVSARLPGDNWQREQAYVEFMKANFGGVPAGYIQRVSNSLAGGEAGLAAFLDLPEPPTALATSTDLSAVGVLHAAHASGLVVPDQMSLVGWDDLTISAFTVPGLTTLKMPAAQIVAEGVRIAVELATDPTASREPSVICFEPTLIVRESTAPPHGRRAGLTSSAKRRAIPPETAVSVPVGEMTEGTDVAHVAHVAEVAAPGSDEFAFAIPVDAAHALGGAIAPGTRVTVVAVPNPSSSRGGSQAEAAILGTNLRVIALRSHTGHPFRHDDAGGVESEALGSVVLAIPAAKLGAFALAAASSKFYLAMTDPNNGDF